MKLVFLDAGTLGEDISLEGFREFGEVVIFEKTELSQVRERTRDADIVIVNKVLMNEKTLGEAPKVKLICITATGTNIVDFGYTDRLGIQVTNVKGYSTASVAQHTFALAFYLLEKLPYYDSFVKSGAYQRSDCFTHFSNVFHELEGKTWGIVGLGDIGRRVADIAKAFGCRVVYYSTSGKNNNPGYVRVEFDELLAEADVVSIHAPLNEDTRYLFDGAAFDRMKESAVLINVGRGPIVKESDLADALRQGKIQGAGLDVLELEPMEENHVLAEFGDSNRLIITPHMAWASVEARNRLIGSVLENIRGYLK